MKFLQEGKVGDLCICVCAYLVSVLVNMLLFVHLENLIIYFIITFGEKLSERIRLLGEKQN